MKWPSITEVEDELDSLNQNVEGECDVRLQVYPDGKWVVRYGLSDYDLDHDGYWGAGTIPGVVDGDAQELDARALAADLLEQARQQHADA